MKGIKLKNNFILIVILLIALFIRLYKLSEIPNGFYVDEAAIGYNAYSLLLTGKDEWGKDLPIFLRSFEAYSSPLYVYGSIVFIKLFGLTIFSVRLLSALSGVLGVWLFYLLLRKLKLFKKQLSYLLAALLFAINPWSLFFSRGAFETNFALPLFLVGVLYFIHAFQKSKWFIFGFIFFALSTYAYQAERLLVLLFIGGFVIFIYGINKAINDNYFKVGGILFLLISTPQLMLMGKEAFAKRAMGLFYSDAIISQAEKLEYFYYPLAYTLSFIREFIARYFTYFSPSSLFYLGDPDLQRSVPEMSVLYPWLVIPFILGIYILFRKLNLKSYKIILILFLITPIPAALTKDPFSTLRAFPLIIPIMAIIGLGIDQLISSKYKHAILLFITVCMVFSGIYFWRSYFVLFPYERGVYWNREYKLLVPHLQKYSDFPIVVESPNKKPLYILHLFYYKTNPIALHNFVGKDIASNYYSGKSFEKPYTIDNVTYKSIVWEEDIFKKQIIVGDAFSISEDQASEHFLTKTFEIFALTGEPVYVGYLTNPDMKCRANPENIHCKND